VAVESELSEFSLGNNRDLELFGIREVWRAPPVVLTGQGCVPIFGPPGARIDGVRLQDWGLEALLWHVRTASAGLGGFR
jgi:hypothetical protein